MDPLHFLVVFFVSLLIGACSVVEGVCPKHCTCVQRVVQCSGLMAFPPISSFPANTKVLIISNSRDAEIRTNELHQLKELTSLTLFFNKIEKVSTFGASKLNIINLEHNEISRIEPGAFDALDDLTELTLSNNILKSFPVFRKPSTLAKLFLRGNPGITILSKQSLRNLPQLNLLSLEATGIVDLPHGIFKRNKHLQDLSLKDTLTLRTINDHAFEGATALAKLRLDNTRVTSLPSQGLENLNLLSLKDVPNLWVLPSNLWNIQEVYLNEYNAFLCCAFYLALGTSDCTKLAEESGQKVTQTSTTQQTATPAFSGPSTTTGSNGSTDGDFGTPPVGGGGGGFGTPPSGGGGGGFGTPPSGGGGGGFGTPHGGDGGFGSPPSSGTGSNPTSPFLVTLPPGFKTVTNNVPSTIPHNNRTNASVYTCPEKRPLVKCYPLPDAFHPCEDIMGATWLTGVSLIIGGTALVANFVVASVLLTSQRRLNVTRFLICNLAFADFCLALYLFVLTCVSLATHGQYYNYVRLWQYGLGCKLVGFFAVFATELSVYTLTVITLERFYAIVYAMQLNTRLSFRMAVRAMIGGWVFALLMATLPLIGGASSYGKVAICLPFDVSDAGSTAYVALLLVLNGMAFAFVLYLYVRMLLVVVRGGRMEGVPRRNDSTVAKKMALLVFTDFICWAPIAFFGLVAAFGKPLIDVTDSKTLLVFFFPLNSVFNPFLYAVFTKPFKREFFVLLSRCGFCKTRALKYAGTLSSFMYSRSRKQSTVDDRSKRLSTASATEFKQSTGSFVNGNITPSSAKRASTYTMNGLSNPGFTRENAVRYVTNVTGSDQVFFPPSPTISNSGSPKSAMKKFSVSNGDRPMQLINEAVESSEENKGSDKPAKKLSVVFKE